MNLQSFFQNFNICKFVVYSSLLAFVCLFTLRLDEFIKIPYVYVFLPVFIWKGLVVVASFIGTVVFLKNPQYRHENDSYIQFKSMLISLSLHLILLMFEFLLCDRLTNGKHLWILVFIPLIVSSIISVFFCIYAIKQNDRSFEIELFLSVNALQFVFIPLKLDGFLNWSWEIVFVPLWIILCLSLVMMLYSLIFCSILIRTPELNITQRQNAISNAISNILVLPILVFQILLADKLDNDNDLPYSLVAIPLIVTLFALILLSFCSKGTCNKFWFGMHNNFFLNMLGEYGNINISYGRNQNAESGTQNLEVQPMEEKIQSNNKKNVPIFPHFSIETPD